MPRERRKWTEAEDAILRDAVLKGGEGACDWHLIASCIPGRTNKDCRKRWHYKVAATVNKGPWEVAEDERLWAAVQEHGSRWALVSQVVKTRNGDQCSKRWYDALDPSIDHSPWTPEEDARLLDAISKHGRNWKAIVKAYFPRRTSLSAKNRYSLLIRKMEPKCKQPPSSTTRKASARALPPPPPPPPPPPQALDTPRGALFHSPPAAYPLPDPAWFAPGEDMSLFFNDLQLAQLKPDDAAAARVITVLINSAIPETVSSIVNQIGREAGVSIAIHLE